MALVRCTIEGNIGQITLVSDRCTTSEKIKHIEAAIQRQTTCSHTWINTNKAVCTCKTLQFNDDPMQLPDIEESLLRHLTKKNTSYCFAAYVETFNFARATVGDPMHIDSQPGKKKGIAPRWDWIGLLTRCRRWSGTSFSMRESKTTTQEVLPPNERTVPVTGGRLYNGSIPGFHPPTSTGGWGLSLPSEVLLRLSDLN